MCCFIAEMDAEHLSNVIFLNVSDTYAVTWNEGITCHFAVDSSLLPGIRHIVGIFPVNWKSTKECLVYDWFPVRSDLQPQQLLDNCIQFPGVYANFLHKEPLNAQTLFYGFV